MTFGDLKPGDKFLEWDVVEGFREYLKDLGTDLPSVPIMTKLDLVECSGYVLKELPKMPNPCNAMASNGKLFSFHDDYEVILIN